MTRATVLLPRDGLLSSRKGSRMPLGVFGRGHAIPLIAFHYCSCGGGPVELDYSYLPH